MNSKGYIQKLFKAILILSSTVNSAEWTKREWEPVDRSGVGKLGRRRTKGVKSEKSFKSGKSGKNDKKSSKKGKDNGYSSIDEGMQGEFNDIYEGFFRDHFSLSSMSMNQVQPLTTSDNTLSLKSTITDTENDKFMSRSSQYDVKMSFAQYSLTFSFMDSVIPTRREDYIELVTTTKSTFEDYMIRFYASDTTSYLNSFEVEFVKTGVSQLDEIYVVLQSTAMFDTGFDELPEVSTAQNSLRDSLARDETLWMEYITALQEMNPDNAFSSTVNVEYILGVPDEKASTLSTTSKADKIAYAAAACITVFSMLALGVKRSRDRRQDEDPNFFEKTSNARSNESCQDTVAETLSCSSFSIYSERSRSYLDIGHDETGASRTESTLCRSYRRARSLSSFKSEIEDSSFREDFSGRTRGVGIDGMGEIWDQNHEDCDSGTTNYNLIGRHCDRDENTYSNDRQWHSLQERQSKTRNQTISETSKHIGDHSNSSLNENDEGGINQYGKGLLKPKEGSEQAIAVCISEKKPQGRLKLIDENNAIERETVDRTFRNDTGSRHHHDKYDSQENLSVELFVLKAEEAARAADELRLKEERRLELDRQSPDLGSRLLDYARRAAELKLDESEKQSLSGKI